MAHNNHKGKNCDSGVHSQTSYSNILHRFVEIAELSPGDGAGVQVSQLTAHSREVLVHFVQILQQNDHAAVTYCRENRDYD